MKVDVSVIVPVYNGERTIKKCVDSILGQSVKSIEVIVVNDGSNDKTAEKLAEISDTRLKVLSIENCGQGMARNRGIELACGEYIGFVDADDTVEVNMYEKMLAVARRNNSDIVQCAINDIYADRVIKRAGVRKECVIVHDVSDYARKYFYTLIHTNEVCNKLFRREFLEKERLSFSDTRKFYSEDLKFNINLLSCIKKISFMDEGFYNYFISESGHCKKNPKERAQKILHLYETCVEEIENYQLSLCIKSMAMINLLSYTAPYINEKWAKDIIRQCRKNGYMTASAKFKGTFKHCALMLLINNMPLCVSKYLIKRYFTF